MKKKGNENLYEEKQNQKDILRKEYFLDEEIESDEEYWLDDEEEFVNNKTHSDNNKAVQDKRRSEKVAGIKKEKKKKSTDTKKEKVVIKSEKNNKPKEKKTGLKKKKIYKNKKIVKYVGITVGVVAILYFVISIYFIDHFYCNTSINGTNFSLKSAKAVENYIKDQVKDYTLTIIEKNDVKEIISGADISLVYEESGEIEEALKSQNPLLWPKAFFDKSSTNVTILVSYDKAKLKEKINGLQTLQVEQTEPVNAYPKYDGEKFVIEPEVTGTAVDLEVLEEKVNQYITEFKSELNMMEDNCYKLPQYTSDSEELQKVCDEMNKYLGASITYTMTEEVVVDKSVINEWIKVDDKMQVVFDETKVRGWLTNFGDTYDTLGTTRSITTPTGKMVQVSGGDYGWSIDEDTEYTALLESIKAGEVIKKEPAYYQTAAAHGAQDWGTTYVEVDLSSQHMWLIQNGAVTLESDVVTGDPTPEKATPTGVYAMKEKLYGTTLIGEIVPETGEPEYRTHVDYWMRVTWSGIGFHDATWQPAFGGSLYQNGYGSHGCINMPYSSAAALIDLVYTGMPVIIHN